MASECFGRPIERPSGISGYRPASWCSVCGRTEAQAEVKQCIKEGCTNVCHLHCLGEGIEFKCGNTGQLRALLGITDPVSPYRNRTLVTRAPPKNPANTSSTQTASTLPAPTEPAVEEYEDDLCDLQREELILLVRNLRRDLTSTNGHLCSYRSAMEELIDKRRLLVEAISIVDTLLAIYTSEGKQYKSVGCTARPHKIDAEVGILIPTEGSTLNPSDSSPTLSPPTPSPSSSPPSNSPSPSQSTSSLPISSPTSSTPSPPTSSPSSNHSPSSSSLNSSSPATPFFSSSPSPALSLPSSSPPTSSSSSSSSTSPSNPAHIPPPSHPSPGSSPTPDLPGGRRCLHQRRFHSKRKPATAPRHQLRQEANHPRQQTGWEAIHPRQQAGQEEIHSRQQLTKCPQCKRQGHTRDQCPRTVCDYCQGRFHSSLTCRVRAADQRQQELVQTIRQSGQQTLLALRSFAWQFNHSSQQRVTGSPVLPPYGPPLHRSPWSDTAPAYAVHHGA